MKFGKLIAVLLVLVTGVSAEVIDTIRFSPDGIFFDYSNQSLTYLGLESISDPGEPSVPVLPYILHTAKIDSPPIVTCRVLKSDTLLLPVAIGRAIEDITTSDDEWKVPAVSSLSSSAVVFPEEAFVATVEHMENNRVISLQLFPIQFVDNQTIIINSEIEISVESQAALFKQGYPSGDDIQNKDRPADKASAGTDINGCPLGGEFVIISSPTLVDAFTDLRDLKRRSGMSADIAVTDSIYNHYFGVDDAEAVRNYLIDFYATGGRYVILGGDEHQVPVRYAYFYNTQTIPELADLMICDLYFADMNGDWDADGDGVWGEPTQDSPDLGMELLVGRLPFSRPEQVAAYTNKLEAYQFHPGDGDPGYLNRSVFFSSDQMRDYDEIGQQYAVAAHFPQGFTADCEKLAELPYGKAVAPTGPFADDAISGLNDGYGIVNILAHGRADGFVVSSSDYNLFPKSYLLTGTENTSGDNFCDIAANNKTAFYYSISCSQATIDLETLYDQTVPSTVEELLSLDNRGAVGMIAFSRWGWVSSSYKLMAAFYSHLFSDAAGSPVLAMQYSWLDFPYYRDQIYGQGYYGDPSLIVYTEAPQQATIASEPVYHPGQPLELTLQAGGSPVAVETITISTPDGEYISVETNGAGVALAVIPPDWDTDISVTALVPGSISAEISLAVSIAADVDDDDPVLPREFDLSQNYPNPFNPTTTISYMTTRAGFVSLQIFNILGELVSEPVCEDQHAGEHEVVWDAKDTYGNLTASGMYFYRLVSEEGIRTRKMILVK